MSSGPIQKVRKPAIMADWIGPGCLYLSLDRDSYISDATIAGMDLVFSDDREALLQAREHEGTFQAVARVDTDLTEVTAGGAVSRRTAQDKISAFVNGLGIEDLAAAIDIFQLAEDKKIGTVLAPQCS
ncbi:MAG: hypothetical protein EXR29_13110 [Betaproteobacteria bacterium]|nr:hypothetical protein [Betaproteobacteria bacterium]